MMNGAKAIAKKYNEISLILRIVVGLVIGAVLALAVPGAGWVGELGSLFVGALKGIAPVLVFVIVASAPTNRLPSSFNHVAPGQTSARITPTTRPIAMRKIRLTPLYAAAIFLRVFIKGFIGASSFFTKSNALTILFSLLRPQRRFH